MTPENKPLETKIEKLQLKNPNKPDTEPKKKDGITATLMPSIPNPEKKNDLVDHSIKTFKLEKVKIGSNGQKIEVQKVIAVEKPK